MRLFSYFNTYTHTYIYVYPFNVKKWHLNFKIFDLTNREESKCFYMLKRVTKSLLKNFLHALNVWDSFVINVLYYLRMKCEVY